MRFTSPGWDSTHEEWDTFCKLWREHKARIRPLLPPALQTLQETRVDDGLVRSLRIDPLQKTMKLCLRCGDLRIGYYDLDLTYSGIELTPQEITLFCLIANLDPDIADDEVDLTEENPPRFVHRLSWHTRMRTDREPLRGIPAITYTLQPEMEMKFTALKLKITPRPDQKFRKRADFITVVRRTDNTDDPLPASVYHMIP